MAKDNLETITLGGGCFWCLEPIYEDVIGVEQVEVGYSGGHVDNPSYKEVTRGTTGHAEVAQVTFDPEAISLEQILKIFFTIHNPTTLNRQGADVGSQYRSAIFYHDPSQKEVAKAVIEELEGEELWDDPFVTEVEPFKTFHRAEEYHQEYYEKNPNAGYCQVVISPKVAKFRKRFADKLKSTQEVGA